MPPQSNIILYVSLDKNDLSRYHLGSTLCLNLVPALNNSVGVQVVSSEDRPPLRWLTGTPCLMDEEGNVYKGSECLLFLQERAIHMAQHGKKTSRDAQSSNSVNAKQASIGVPVMQLRSDDKQASVENMMNNPRERGVQESLNNEEEEDLWSSIVQERDIGEETVEGNNKLTSDDFTKFMEQRREDTKK